MLRPSKPRLSRELHLRRARGEALDGGAEVLVLLRHVVGARERDDEGVERPRLEGVHGGLRLGVVEVEDGAAAARLEHAPQLPECQRDVRYVAQPVTHRRRVKGFVRERQRQCVALHPPEGRVGGARSLRCALRRHLQKLLGKVQSNHAATTPRHLRGAKRQIPAPTTHVKARLAPPQSAPTHRSSLPNSMLSETEHIVQEIVLRRDFVEQAFHLLCGCRVSQGRGRGGRGRGDGSGSGRRSGYWSGCRRGHRCWRRFRLHRHLLLFQNSLAERGTLGSGRRLGSFANSLAFSPRLLLNDAPACRLLLLDALGAIPLLVLLLLGGVRLVILVLSSPPLSPLLCFSWVRVGEAASEFLFAVAVGRIEIAAEEFLALLRLTRQLVLLCCARTRARLLLPLQPMERLSVGAIRLAVALLLSSQLLLFLPLPLSLLLTFLLLLPFLLLSQRSLFRRLSPGGGSRGGA
mmetsp:Transcript_22417/g.72775  ORF Transcript_22417/g.72775 Transcript_22417/m.72775 type:complete len:463 (+) Transcript_22417:588-1976(+)